MANKIVTLKDKSNNELYPVVLSSCIYDENNNPLRISDTIIEHWISSDGTTWYRKWASGWKECGGITGEMSSYSVTIALPVTFSNTNYIVHVTPLAMGNDTYNHNAQNKTTTSFLLRNRADEPCQWSAMGY